MDIDGKKVSSKIKDELKANIELNKYNLGIAVIQIGNDEASNIYIHQKQRVAEELGIVFYAIKFDASENLEILENKIIELNKDKNINGIIIQLPLPPKFTVEEITHLINLIDPSKDIDGLTDYNRIKLINNEQGFIPCTPLGVLALLKFYNIEVSGKNVVIIGRSNLVSKPLFNLLLNMNATVTICHSKTKDLSMYTKNADILISATGKKHLIKEYMVKNNSVIIDIGITRENGKLYGDVDYDNIKDIASYITPVPGGVGPMTVIMLMKNLLESYENANGKK